VRWEVKIAHLANGLLRFVFNLGQKTGSIGFALLCGGNFALFHRFGRALPIFWVIGR